MRSGERPVCYSHRREGSMPALLHNTFRSDTNRPAPCVLWTTQLPELPDTPPDGTQAGILSRKPRSDCPSGQARISTPQILSPSQSCSLSVVRKMCPTERTILHGRTMDMGRTVTRTQTSQGGQPTQFEDTPNIPRLSSCEWPTSPGSTSPPIGKYPRHLRIRSVPRSTRRRRRRPVMATRPSL